MKLLEAATIFVPFFRRWAIKALHGFGVSLDYILQSVEFTLGIESVLDVLRRLLPPPIRSLCTRFLLLALFVSATLGQILLRLLELAFRLEQCFMSVVILAGLFLVIVSELLELIRGRFVAVLLPLELTIDVLVTLLELVVFILDIVDTGL